MNRLRAVRARGDAIFPPLHFFLVLISLCAFSGCKSEPIVIESVRLPPEAPAVAPVKSPSPEPPAPPELFSEASIAGIKNRIMASSYRIDEIMDGIKAGREEVDSISYGFGRVEGYLRVYMDVIRRIQKENLYLQMDIDDIFRSAIDDTIQAQTVLPPPPAPPPPAPPPPAPPSTLPFQPPPMKTGIGD